MYKLKAPNMVYNKKLAVLMKKNKTDSFDGTCFLLGIMSFLNQFHSSNTKIFLGLLSQYIKTTINFNLSSKDAKANAETVPTLLGYMYFFEEFTRYSEDKVRVK